MAADFQRKGQEKMMRNPNKILAIIFLLLALTGIAGKLAYAADDNVANGINMPQVPKVAVPNAPNLPNFPNVAGVGIPGMGGAPKPGSAIAALNAVCGDAFQIDTGQQLKVVSGMAGCFDFIIGGMAEGSLTDITDYMKNTIAILLVLYVIFFGAKIALGITSEQKAKGELVIGGIKIGFIAFLFFNYGIVDLWYMTMDMYASLVQIVLAPTNAGDCKIIRGDLNTMWTTMDCLLGQFLGWNQVNGAGIKTEVPLLFSFLGTLFTQGIGGGLTAVIVVFALFNVLMSFFRVLFVYIFSMIGLLIMFTIAPIFVPLMLFEKTKSYFDSWWKQVVSLIVQPVLLFAFMGFMVVMFNQIMTGPGGLLEVFRSMLPHGEVYETHKNGTFVEVMQAWVLWVNSNPENAIQLTKDVSYSLLSIFAMSYILMAFADFVDDMGKALGGSHLSPNLSQFLPRIPGM